LFQEKHRRNIGYVQVDEEDLIDDADAYFVQWARTSQPLQCQWVRQPEPTPGFDFDVTKTEQIFDLLLQEKRLVPMAGHQTPSAEEMRGRKYCKWHNRLDRHDTNNCRVLRIEIQRAIEQGKLVYARPQLKIDTTPFPVNAVYAIPVTP